MRKKIIVITLAVLAVALVGIRHSLLQAPAFESGNSPVVNPVPDSRPIIKPDQISKIEAGYVAGHITIGPLCPVEREGEPCGNPQAAYAARRVVIYASDGMTVIKRGAINEEGDYKIALAPGKYFVQIEPAGIGPGEKKQVTILASKTSVVDFDIDTGIR